VRIPPGLLPGCCTRCDPGVRLIVITGLTVPPSQVGLLSKDNVEQIPFAYKLFKSENNTALAQGFKTTFSREVPIEFVGVWWVSWYYLSKTSCPRNMLGRTPNLSRLIYRDTVASVGVIMGKTLPFVDVNTTIRVFRQALALDEVCADDLISRFLSRARCALLAPLHYITCVAFGHVPVLLPHHLSYRKLTSTFHPVASRQIPPKLVPPFSYHKTSDGRSSRK